MFTRYMRDEAFMPERVLEMQSKHDIRLKVTVIPSKANNANSAGSVVEINASTGH